MNSDPNIPNMQVQTPTTPELPTQPEKLLPSPHHTSWGAVFGIIIILIVLVIGALYFWSVKLAEQDAKNAKPVINAGLEASGVVSE